uniref:Acyl-CoA binding domain containing 7 n=1 Tax=Nothobranchius furzeri TaxID=105023 RepID=A0A8C6MG62_NOTFU
MSQILCKFKKVADDVKKVKTQPTNEELLTLYGLYKQVLVGDVNTERPTVDPTGKAKWDAWQSRKAPIKFEIYLFNFHFYCNLK